MCITTKDGAWITTGDHARDWLTAQGFDRWDIDELGGMIQPVEYADLEYDYDNLKREFRSYERSLNAAQGVLSDLLNMCLEWCEKERTQAGQRIAREVYDYIQHSEVF